MFERRLFVPEGRKALAKPASMESLDLRIAPPRSPNLELGGLLMLARTIDKARASLPGGDLGAYRFAGFSAGLLKGLGIEEADFVDAVKTARGDDDVVAWVRARSDAAAYPELNAKLQRRTVGDVIDDADFVERYPVVAGLPHDTPLLHMLDHDDKAAFA